MAHDPLVKVFILWVWFHGPGVMADIPRDKGWHVWGTYPSVEICMDAVTEVREDRKENGIEGILFAACKQKKNTYASPSLTVHDGSDTLHWRWVLWLHHKHDWSFRGLPMGPGWHAASDWASKEICDDVWSRIPVPVEAKRCVRADKFPGEVSKLHRLL